MIDTVILTFLLILMMTIYISIFINRRIYTRFFRHKKFIHVFFAMAGIELLMICAGLAAGLLLTVSFAPLLGPLAVLPVIALFLIAAVCITVIELIRVVKKAAIRKKQRQGR